MRVRGVGYRELFVPHATSGDHYKFDIIGPQGQHLPLKSAPLACCGNSPEHGIHRVRLSQVAASSCPAPADVNALSEPMSIYEVHLGSWRHKGNNEWLTYRDHVTELLGQQREVRFFGYQSRSDALPLMQLTYKIEKPMIAIRRSGRGPRPSV